MYGGDSWRPALSHTWLALTIFLAIRITGVPSPLNDRTIDAAARSGLKEEMAVVELNRALGQTTGPGSAAAQSAESFYRKHDFAHALEQIEAAIRTEPKDRTYLGMRAAIHAAQDNVYAAIADYTQMLALDPNDVEVYRKRARLYKIMRDFTNASTDLDTAIKLAPKDAQNYAEKARLNYAQQRYQDAAKDYEAALALDSSNRQYLREQTVTYEYLKQFPRAFAECDNLMSIDPTVADGYECRADVSAVMGDKKRALDNLDQAIPRDLVPAKRDSSVKRLDRSRWNRASPNHLRLQRNWPHL